MNVTFAFCAMVMAGVSAELGEPVSPSRQSLPAQPTYTQLSYTQATGAHAARPTNEGALRRPSMPVPPTDPRAFARDDLPLPPTMNDAATPPSTARAGAAPRPNPAGLGETGSHRLPAQRAFDNYRPTPATSPYLLINGPTSNGTISTYAAYVRPAQQQQQANQEFDRPTSNMGSALDQPAPTYPPAFLNYGSYYPAAR